MKQKRRFKRALLGALIVLLVAGTTGCTGTRMIKYVIRRVWSPGSGKSAGSDVLGKDTSSKLGVLDELIDEYYMGDVDESKLTEGIYKGYLSGLGDPYSAYYDEEETKELSESLEGEYSGIGAVLSQNADTGVITILQVYPDSPAEEAGIKDNDILYKVAGEEVTGEDLTMVVSRIRGEEGTQVELTVLRGEDMDEIPITATRRTIQVITVTSKMLDDDIGYIGISEFDSVTLEQYADALDELKAQNMKGLIVDLRNNPGGYVDTVVGMLDLMLPKGTVLSMKDKSGKETTYTSDHDTDFDLPLAVLVNGYSASASEIFSGAIQDFDAGDIVGTKTYGKGVVQNIYNLGDGTSVKLTIAEYFLPSGRSINKQGVTPDVEVVYEADPDHPDADNQLDMAIEVIKGKL